jgi:hypothetical protein
MDYSVAKIGPLFDLSPTEAVFSANSVRIPHVFVFFGSKGIHHLTHPQKQRFDILSQKRPNNRGFASLCPFLQNHCLGFLGPKIFRYKLLPPRLIVFSLWGISSGPKLNNIK